MTKNYICILAFVCNCLCLAEWPRRTSAEDDIFRALLQRVMDKDEDAAWSEMDKLPLHVLMSEMVRCLSSQAIRDKPEVFEHFRAMVLAKPDWEEWVQSEIDRFRAMKTIRHRISRSYPGAENEPEILLKENQLNQEDYLGLCDIQYFLPMLCTAESVPVMAQ